MRRPAVFTEASHYKAPQMKNPAAPIIPPFFSTNWMMRNLHLLSNQLYFALSLPFSAILRGRL